MIVYLFLFVVKFLHRFFFFYCCFDDVRYPWYMLNPYVTRPSPETLHEGLVLDVSLDAPTHFYSAYGTRFVGILFLLSSLRVVFFEI
jgi:hypothetical protein